MSGPRIVTLAFTAAFTTLYFTLSANGQQLASSLINFPAAASPPSALSRAAYSAGVGRERRQAGQAASDVKTLLLISGKAMAADFMTSLYRKVEEEAEENDEDVGGSERISTADVLRFRRYMESSDTVLTFFPARITQRNSSDGPPPSTNGYELEFSFGHSPSPAEEGGNGTWQEVADFFTGLEQVVSAELHFIPTSVDGNATTPPSEVIGVVQSTGQSPVRLSSTSFNITHLAREWLSQAPSSSQKQLLTVQLTANGQDAAKWRWNVVGIAFFATRGSVDSSAGGVWKRKRRRREAISDVGELGTSERVENSTAEEGGGVGTGCRVHSLYVDFANENLRWDRWVIAPRGFLANYCDGDCLFPLAASLSPTNHAVVRSLIRLVDTTRIDGARCAPVEMAPQQLLYYNQHGDVVMRRYPEMRVKRCGCQ